MRFSKKTIHDNTATAHEKQLYNQKTRKTDRLACLSGLFDSKLLY